MMQKGNQDAQQYVNYNYCINNDLGYLEYDLREKRIGEEDFKKGCEIVYEKYKLDFDVLKQNLDCLETSEQNNKKIQ